VPSFSVQLTKPAKADLEKIPASTRPPILEGIASLEENPFPGPNKRRLRGFKFPLYRLRVEDFRARYRIDQQLVTIMRIINRKDLEKITRHLKW